MVEEEDGGRKGCRHHSHLEIKRKLKLHLLYTINSVKMKKELSQCMRSTGNILVHPTGAVRAVGSAMRNNPVIPHFMLTRKQDVTQGALLSSVIMTIGKLSVLFPIATPHRDPQSSQGW
ncbi:hypothetical protein E2C01_051541 [Portunus trituberculatus]|uniref:Uncharacterized protein n=1 Tax=Portunus trituberculatus TaxID=210409 RepID=A0A5B7GKL0_PORTR|nr:hypothetical protein [Portunus trituberculatus]